MRKTRQKSVDEIKLLRSHGLSNAEIAEKMGIKINSIYKYLWDPDGKKTQEARSLMMRPCPVCETTLIQKHAKQCLSCYRAKVQTNLRWSPETTAEAIQRFHQEFGHVPTSRDMFDISVRRRDYPSQKHAIKHHGSWANAVEAAGFPRPRHGGNGPQKNRVRRKSMTETL